MTAAWFPSPSATPDDPPEPPRRSTLMPLIIALVLVLILGTVAAVVAFRGPREAPAQPTPASPSPSAVAAPALDCQSPALDQFFATPAGSTAEDARRDQLQAYADQLLAFVCDQQPDLGAFHDPVVGQWNGEAGYFTFSDQVFGWYLSAGNLSDNYYRGDYLWLPGCQTTTGLALASTGPCYSVLLRYTESVSIHTPSAEVFYGLLLVAQTDPNTLDVTNQRSGGQFSLDRVG